ncbi:sporulation protein [Nonomuraea sp. NPDC059194]|uniref:sporulation protein n=1 Tax=Nonomuraea sp. NPDC059194 TaxID=3346764 RepID=UPI0036D03CE8
MGDTHVRERIPNLALDQVIAASGASHKALAHRINELALQWGHETHYTHTSVANWLRGMTPQWPVPMLIATALQERLGRRVTMADIGMTHAEPIETTLGLDFPRDLPSAVVGTTQFWSHMHRRTFMDAVFAATALATPVVRWLTQPADPEAEHRGGRRVGRRDIAELHEAAEHARHWDSRYGGGSSGASLVTHVLQTKAAPLLEGSYPDQIGRELFSATAQLARLAGFAAADMHRHGLAQRHYTQALRLSRAAGDVPLGGYVLASMAMQASLTGHLTEAIDMAQAATERTKHAATPRTLAFFALIEARAHARAGDRNPAEHAFARSERLLGRATGADDPQWIDFFGFPRLAADAAEIYRDLRMPGQVMHWNALAAMPTAKFVRSHGLRLTVIASSHSQAGNLDEALHAGHQAIDVLTPVTSQRSVQYLGDFLQGLTPWSHEKSVQEIKRRAARELAIRVA